MSKRAPVRRGRLTDDRSPLGRVVEFDDGDSGLITVATLRAAGWESPEELGPEGTTIDVRQVSSFMEGGRRQRRFAPRVPGPNGVRDLASLAATLEVGQQRVGVLRNWNERMRFVDLGYGLDGVIRLDEIRSAGQTAPQHLGRVDELIDVRIVELDRTKTPIGVSLATLQSA